MTTTNKVPALLDFAPDGTLIPGRGRAGWTVYTFPTPEAAAAFVTAHPVAAMPCWRRFRIVAGALTYV